MWTGSFFPGGGVHLLIPLETYTTYDFPWGQDALSNPTPLDYTVLWLFHGSNQYCSGLVYVFHCLMSRSTGSGFKASWKTSLA